MIVGVAGNLDVIALGVSGVVMHDHADGLAHTGHVVLLDMAGHTGLHLTEALLTVEHLMVGHIVEDDRRDILVVRHVEVQVVAALGLGDLQVLGLRFLGIDRNGEFPRVLEVLAAAVAVRQGRLDADGRLGIIGQLGIVRIGAVPRRDAVIFRVNACGRDAVIVVAVNGLGNILADLAVIYLAVFTGNGILQALCVAQQARVDARQTVLKVVVVRRNGVAVGKVRNLCVAVLADVGIDRVLAGGGECGVHIRLRLAGRAVKSLPVVGRVHDRRNRPVAVERKERHAQIDGIGQLTAVLVHLRQGDKTVHERAVGKRGHLRRIGQRDGHGDCGRLAGSYCNAVVLAVRGEGVCQLNGALARGHELLVITVFIDRCAVRQDDGLNVVIERLVAGVMYREAHGIHAGLFRIVLQLKLRTLLSLNGEIALGIHGIGNAHQAGALFARRIGMTVLVIKNVCRAHEQGVGQMLALARIGHAARLECLLHNGHAACNVRRSHGRAVHALIVVAGNRGIDTGAGRGNLRLEHQLGRRSPGGEVGHAGDGRFHGIVKSGDGQGLGLLLLHVLSGCLRDECTGHLPVGNGHVEHARRIVVNQHADRTCGLGIVHLGLVVDAAAFDKGDLSIDIDLGKVLGRARARNDGVFHFALLGKRAQSDGICILTDQCGVLIGDLLLAHGDEGAGHHGIADRRDGHGLCIGGRLTAQAVVRVGRKCLAAERIAVGRAVSVARCNREGRAAFADLFKDVQQILCPLVLGIIVNIARVGAKAQVGDIDAQRDAVLERTENVGIGRTAGGFEHVHVDDLCLGCNTHDLVINPRAACRGGGNVRAVAALGSGQAVLVLVAVVELERELRALVEILDAQAGNDLSCLELLVRKELLQAVLGQGRRSRFLGEDLVRHIDAGVQDRNEHPFAVEAGLVVQAAADHLVAVGGCRNQLKSRRNER